MPSAEELRTLSDENNRIDLFIRTSEREAADAARMGEKYVFIEAPLYVSRDRVENVLKETFPGCSVSRRTFTAFYRISWA